MPQRATRLGASGDIGLLRLTGCGEVQRDGMSTHLRDVSTAVQQNLEVLVSGDMNTV